MPKLQTVHVRVNDAATGKPTPCRMRVVDGAGNYYAPLGRMHSFATRKNQDVGGNVRVGSFPHAYIDGSCEINLPVGPLQFQFQKGFEFATLTQDVELLPGKLSLRFNLQRWIDLPSLSWYSGDTRVHFLSPHAALLEAQAEDVHVVNLLATEVELDGGGGAKHPSISNILAFSGQDTALAKPPYWVAVNSWNSHPELGSLALLNCHRVVYPLSFGGLKGQDDWTLADWCDQCHRKNGMVIWSQTAHESQDFLFGEPLADLMLGKIDAFEIDHFEDSPFDVIWLWYDLLNAGWRVPLAGASGKDSNASALGVMRTFVNLLPGQELSYSSWIEALRVGRSFVSNGPVLLLAVNGQAPGSIVPLDGLGAKVHIHATCQTQSHRHRLEILLNGEVIGAVSNEQHPECSVFDAELAIDRSGWLAARCIGEGKVFDKPANQLEFAHTSPVHLEAQDRPAPRSEKVVQKFKVELERMEAWAQEKARCQTAAQRQRLVNIFVAAKGKLLR